MRKKQSVGSDPRSLSHRCDQISEDPSRFPIFDPNDEDHIGEPFYRFQQLKRIDPHAAIQVFSQFKAALMRRIASEEAELFPAFEARAGEYAMNISGSMRQEHQQIRKILEAIEAKLSLADMATETEERALEAALIAHNHREMRVVYSALE